MTDQQPPYPEYPAVRAYIDALAGKHVELAELLDIDPRTAQRIYSGKWKPGPFLLKELIEAANG